MTVPGMMNDTPMRDRPLPPLDIALGRGALAAEVLLSRIDLPCSLLQTRFPHPLTPTLHPLLRPMLHFILKTSKEACWQFYPPFSATARWPIAMAETIVRSNGTGMKVVGAGNLHQHRAPTTCDPVTAGGRRPSPPPQRYPSLPCTRKQDVEHVPWMHQIEEPRGPQGPYDHADLMCT